MSHATQLQDRRYLDDYLWMIHRQSDVACSVGIQRTVVRKWARHFLGSAALVRLRPRFSTDADPHPAGQGPQTPGCPHRLACPPPPSGADPPPHLPPTRPSRPAPRMQSPELSRGFVQRILSQALAAVGFPLTPHSHRGETSQRILCVRCWTGRGASSRPPAFPGCQVARAAR